MTVTINGTNGVTTPEVVLDNSAADGAQVVLKSSGYSDWNLDNYSGRLRAYYGSTEYWTVDANGNLGLGVTPSAWGTAKAIQVGSSGFALSSNGSGAGDGSLNWNGYYNGTNWIYSYTGGAATRYRQNESGHAWFTAPSGTAGNAISFTQAMTLDTSGRLLVGKTTNGDYVAGVEMQPAGAVLSYRTSGVAAIFGRTDNGETVRFTNNGNGVGTISTTGSATAYNTSSDYRLKHDIAPMTGALAKVQALNPVTYKWNADNSESQGFIAHELQAVVPDCVTGEKDAVDADGNPVYQGIDTSFLVATLTAAIQELKAINDAQAQTITALTARVTALEGA